MGDKDIPSESKRYLTRTNIMSGDVPDFCECFFARMRNSVQEFQNILSSNRDSNFNGPNGGTADDPFALDNTEHDGGMSSTTMLLTLFLVLIVTIMYQMSKNTK